MRNAMVKFFVLVAMLATFNLPAVGQPPQSGGDPLAPSVIEAESPETITPNRPIGKPPDTPPACPAAFPTPVPATQPEPARTADNTYSDGRTTRQAKAWRQSSDTGPAYSPAVVQQVTTYVQGPDLDDKVYKFLEEKVVNATTYKVTVTVTGSGRSLSSRMLAPYGGEMLVDQMMVEGYCKKVSIISSGLATGFRLQMVPAKKAGIATWFFGAGLRANRHVQQSVQDLKIRFEDFVQAQAKRDAGQDQALTEVITELERQGFFDKAKADELRGKLGVQPATTNSTTPTTNNATAGNATVNTVTTNPAQPASDNLPGTTPTPAANNTSTAAATPTVTAPSKPVPTETPVSRSASTTTPAMAPGGPTASDNAWTWPVLGIVGVGTFVLALVYLGARNRRIAAERKRDAAPGSSTTSPGAAATSASQSEPGETSRETTAAPPGTAPEEGAREFHEGEIVEDHE